MTTADSIHVLPADRALEMWAKGMPAIRIARELADDRGDRFSENAVRLLVLSARKLGDPRAIYHRPGAKKKDWRG